MKTLTQMLNKRDLKINIPYCCKLQFKPLQGLWGDVLREALTSTQLHLSLVFQVTFNFVIEAKKNVGRECLKERGRDRSGSRKTLLLQR